VKLLATISLVITSSLVWAQHNAYSEVSQDSSEAKSLIDWLQKGSYGGLMRYQFMGTSYDEGDFYANAIGGRLHYETASLKGFHIGVAGNFVYNIWSSEFTSQSPATFEKQLFDLENPKNKKDLDRLEELYVKYTKSGITMVLGKQVLNTPLVNAQDSRMKPSVFRGFKNSWHFQSTHAEIGYYDKVSPRSTVEWLSIDESIDLYKNTSHETITEEPKKAKSEGLIISGLEHKINNVALSFWNYTLLNISSTSLLEGEYVNDHWMFGSQLMFQDHELEDFNSVITSSCVIYKNSHFKFSGASSFIIDEGKFVFPREFGTADLYTKASRHRIESLTNFKTYSLGTTYYPHEDHHFGCTVKVLRTSYYLNEKNTNDSIKQLNLEVDYVFDGLLEGLNLKALAVLSRADQRKQSNYSHFNLFANINF